MEVYSYYTSFSTDGNNKRYLAQLPHSTSLFPYSTTSLVLFTSACYFLLQLFQSFQYDNYFHFGILVENKPHGNFSLKRGARITMGIFVQFSYPTERRG